MLLPICKDGGFTTKTKHFWNNLHASFKNPSQRKSKSPLQKTNQSGKQDKTIHDIRSVFGTDFRNAFSAISPIPISPTLSCSTNSGCFFFSFPFPVIIQNYFHNCTEQQSFLRPFYSLSSSPFSKFR